MKKLDNLEHAIVAAVINPDYFGRKVFGLFYVNEQIGETLKVNCFWNLDYPNSNKGWIDFHQNSIKEITVNDIWICIDALSELQQNYLQENKINYRFHKDSDALERLATKLDMDLNYIGYEGEPEEGTWFTCCRINTIIKNILPKSLHIYSLRSSDEDDSQPASIEDNVMVNHYGDILIEQQLLVPMELEVEQIKYDEEGNIIE